MGATKSVNYLKYSNLFEISSNVKWAHWKNSPLHLKSKVKGDISQKFEKITSEDTFFK